MPWLKAELSVQQLQTSRQQQQQKCPTVPNHRFFLNINTFARLMAISTKIENEHANDPSNKHSYRFVTLYDISSGLTTTLEKLSSKKHIANIRQLIWYQSLAQIFLLLVFLSFLFLRISRQFITLSVYQFRIEWPWSNKKILFNLHSHRIFTLYSTE